MEEMDKQVLLTTTLVADRIALEDLVELRHPTTGEVRAIPVSMVAGVDLHGKYMIFDAAWDAAEPCGEAT